MTAEEDPFEKNAWLDALDEAEKDRLRARLRALAGAMSGVRGAASGEEPLFPAEVPREEE